MRRHWISLGAAAAMAAIPALSQAASVTPATFSATIGVGGSVSVGKVVQLDDVVALNKVDVFFLADNTGSMGGILTTVKNNATSILNAIDGGDSRFTGIDVAFGVGRYLGDPVEGVAAGTAYQLQQAITDSKSAAQTAIGGWFASGGGDLPEANFFALHQVATEGGSTPNVPNRATNQVTGWREGAGRVIVWFGDARSHTATVDQAQTIAALTGADVIVAAINTQGSGSGIDQFGQAAAIAAATGGSLTNSVSGTTATVDAILDAVEAATSTVDLTWGLSGDTSGLEVGFVCTDPLGCLGVGPGESRTFTMTVKGLVPGTYDFTAFVVGVSGAVERDRITVSGGGGPGGVIPEPGTILLLGTGLLGLGGVCRRRKA